MSSIVNFKDMNDIEKYKQILDDRLFEYLMLGSGRAKKKTENKNKIVYPKSKDEESRLVAARISTGISNTLNYRGIKRNRRHWSEFVDYSINEVIYHLKKSLKMLDGYTWNDFLNGRLQIDHILPQSFFEFNSEYHPEFKRCWALDNLRLLPRLENRLKSNKCDNFQKAF